MPGIWNLCLARVPVCVGESVEEETAGEEVKKVGKTPADVSHYARRQCVGTDARAAFVIRWREKEPRSLTQTRGLADRVPGLACD